jgi:type IX secretion system substrate protein
MKSQIRNLTFYLVVNPRIAYGLLAMMAGLAVLPSMAQENQWVTVIPERVYSLAEMADGRIIAGGGAGQVFLSADGVSWTTRILDSQGGNTISIDVAPTGEVLASNGRGLFLSEDHGETWTQINSFGAIHAISAARYPEIYLGIPSGIARSTDAGATFPDGDGIDAESWALLGWSLASAGNGVMVAGSMGCLEASCGRIFVSRDGGESWVDTGQEFPVEDIAVVRRDLWIAASGNGSFSSRDQGLTWWSDIPRAIQIASNGDQIITVYYDGRILLSTNGAISFADFGSVVGGKHDLLITDGGLYLAATGVGGFLSASQVATVPPSVPKERRLTLWPNPASTVLNVTSPGITHSATAEVYDILGRRVETVPISNGTVSIRQLQPGVYYLTIQQNGHTYSAQFTKVR